MTGVYRIQIMILIFSMRPVWAAPPSNDNFANVVTLSGNMGSVSGSNVEATGETGEPQQTTTLNSIMTTSLAGVATVIIVPTTLSHELRWRSLW